MHKTNSSKHYSCCSSALLQCRPHPRDRPLGVTQQVPAVLAVHHELLPLLAAVVERTTHVGDDCAHVTQQVDAVAHNRVIQVIALPGYAVGKLDDAWDLTPEVVVRLGCNTNEEQEAQCNRQQSAYGDHLHIGISLDPACANNEVPAC